MNITIQNEFASVTCRTLGAELLSYKTAAGKEYMWQKDPAYWAKTSPVLFPYIGAVPETVTIHGVGYKIPRHGFVKDAEFEVAEKGDDYVILSTGTNDYTTSVYPYDFRFTVTFRLEQAKLVVTYGVENKGDKEMPFLIGGHPAFFCPMEEGEQFTDYMLHFEDEMVPDLHLQYPMFDNDAILYENLNNRTVKLIHQTTGKGIQFDFQDMKVLHSGLRSKKMRHSSVSNPGAAAPWIRCLVRICFRKNMCSISPPDRHGIMYLHLSHVNDRSLIQKSCHTIILLTIIWQLLSAARTEQVTLANAHYIIARSHEETVRSEASVRTRWISAASKDLRLPLQTVPEWRLDTWQMLLPCRCLLFASVLPAPDPTDKINSLIGSRVNDPQNRSQQFPLKE